MNAKFFLLVLIFMSCGNLNVFASYELFFLRPSFSSAYDNKAFDEAVIQSKVPCCFVLQSVQSELLLDQKNVVVAYEVPTAQGYSLLQSSSTQNQRHVGEDSCAYFILSSLVNGSCCSKC